MSIGKLLCRVNKALKSRAMSAKKLLSYILEHYYQLAILVIESQLIFILCKKIIINIQLVNGNIDLKLTCMHNNNVVNCDHWFIVISSSNPKLIQLRESIKDHVFGVIGRFRCDCFR